MKILNFTEANRAAVAAQKEKAAAMLATLLKSDKTRSQLEQQLNRVEAEIAELEAGNAETRFVQALTDKRTERELVMRRLDEIPNYDAEMMDAKAALLREATKLLNQILLPTYNGYVAEVAKLLRPYCANDAWATHVAQQTEAAIQLCAAIARNYAANLHGSNVNQFRELLKRCDEVLTGELDWKYQPSSH